MQPINPEWYDELKGEPLRERNFTESLASRIKKQAALPGGSGQMRHRLAAAGLAATIAAASLIFYDGLRAKPAGLESGPVESIVAAPEVSAAAGDGSLSLKFGPMVPAGQAAGGEADPVLPRHALLVKQASNRAKFDFWTVRYEDGSYKLGADYYDKEGNAQDWKLRDSASFSEKKDVTFMSARVIFSRSFGYDGFTVLAGEVGDDAIASVRLTDGSGTQTDANIARNADGRFWVAIVTGDPSGYTLQPLDREDKAVGVFER